MKKYYHHNDNGISYEHVFIVDEDNQDAITYFISPTGMVNNRSYKRNYGIVYENINKPNNQYTKLTEEQFNEWLFIHGL